MRKTIISILAAFLAFAIIVPVASIAQTESGAMAVGGGLDLCLPMGDFGDGAGTGFGLTGRFEYIFNPNMTFTGTLGYISWGGKDLGIYEYSYSHIPIKGGLKYYINPEKKQLYAGGELGLNMFSWSWKGSGIIGFDPNTGAPIYGDFDESDSEARFGIAILGGYEMPLNETLTLDISGRYELISDANFLGFRVGILYPLGKQ